MVLQTETIDLNEEGSRADRSSKIFRRSAADKSAHSLIDVDGLPYIGQVRCIESCPFYGVFIVDSSMEADNLLAFRL